ncbi:Lipin/Ned1/Smp2-domain-containing protein [Phascolomyces articulosus]|uniref:Lipin/Ned1/Smp2-domain-containing protein n=1 Tax=Phascolomyces articulosus TaxID=60185 RepID=A0AAD5JXH1_9FUNG|nr:Lipin/Ned1/Smp2-domain-containing protein [Phascolomyces articulosus]
MKYPKNFKLHHCWRQWMKPKREPPYLDIGESKGQSTTASTEIKGSKALPNNSTNDINKIRIPAELQSPKMIIEEQMDKVVTKMDPYQKHHHQHLEHMTDKLTLQDDDKKIANHDTYPLDDGSTLLERVQPAEAVTSTTIAKETKSTSPPQSSSPSSLATTTNTTMMTQTRKSRSSSTSMVGTKKLQLEPGVVYRIELSLCGLTTFGTKEEDNATLFNEHQITYDKFVHNPNLLNDQRLVFRYEGRYYAAGRTGPLFTSLFLFHEPPPMDKNRPHQDNNQDSDSRESYLFGRGWRQWWSRSSVTGPTSAMDNNNLSAGPNDDNRVNKDGEEEKNEKTTTTRLTTTTTTTSVGWSPDHHHEHHPLDQQKQTLEEQQPVMVPPTPHKNYAKTLRLTSDQLKCLGLKKGANTISFSVTTEYQGTAICMAQIFYWDHDIQIVISDIDGTITKSDALGHVFNFIGKDWTHTGVAKLYTDITNNGYHILYLTSRAIGQADYTRDYLKRVEQDGKHQLPAGPVIMSPDRLFTSFHREVIMRKPEVFKMACLRDIQRLFGDDSKPFYAGFGNRITDAISYRSVHVPASRIFTIDPNGDVKLELLLGFLSSYIHLNDLVDQIFPPINKNIGEEFNDWNYWKQPLPEIDIPDLPIISSTKASPVPIKPDPTGALPSETIIESEAQKQRQQRSKLLRSFTSRSSSTTTNNSISESTPLSSRLGARHFSTSTPSLVITSRSGRTSPAESARSASPPSPSSPENEKYHAIPHYSSSDDLLSAPNSNNNNATSPAPSSTSSTSSLMNKMTTGFGGVLSRTFAARKSSLSEELLDHPATLSRTGSKGEVDDQQPTFDMDDEDDELDLDSIPFI